MLLGNDQDVGGSLRADVVECVGAIVFVNSLGRGFTPDYAAEEATRFVVGHEDSFKSRVSSCKREVETILYQPWLEDLRPENPRPKTQRLIQPHQKYGSLRCLRTLRHFLRALFVVVLDSHPYPPVSGRAGKAEHLCRVIFAGQVIG